MKIIILLLLFVCSSFHAFGHEQRSEAIYLGNEGVLVMNESTKIVFDPFFHNNYNIYQMVPQPLLDKMFNNDEPYNDITAILISHAHGDHFDAGLIQKYLKLHSNTQLIGPSQATEQVLKLDSSLSEQIHSIELNYKDAPLKLNIDDLLVEVVRIPHSGWPTRRLDISNLSYRVTLDDSLTVMHMGDADPNHVHFDPYAEHWKASLTNMAFPPYWFYYSSYGPKILNETINAEASIGVHVPVEVPLQLKQTGAVYFSKPGETRPINHKHEKTSTINKSSNNN